MRPVRSRTRSQPPSRIRISLIDIPAGNDGLAGAELATEDDNATGRFLNQRYTLIEKLLGEGDDPVTADTLFPIASCTKSFTTTALALLADEGKLAFDDPVRKHVPFFHLGDALADREVTLRDLVCHRTGLGPHEMLWYRAPWPAEETVRRAGRLPLDRPFRSAFQYQSTMFTVAGFAAAKTGEADWDELVRRRLLQPSSLP